jgi:hypothetical protein
MHVTRTLSYELLSCLNNNLISFLPLRTLKNWIVVNKLNTACLQWNETWKQICLLRWPGIDPNIEVDDWKTEIYEPLQAAIAKEGTMNFYRVTYF